MVMGGILLETTIVFPKQHSIWALVGPNWNPFGNAAWVVKNWECSEASGKCVYFAYLSITITQVLLSI